MLQLKFYGGRSIVSSLLESPLDRKKLSVLEIVDAFSESKFICFGDSGEQDLELYLSIARERPKQVLGVYIRDITSGRAHDFKRMAAVRAPALEDEELRKVAHQLSDLSPGGDHEDGETSTPASVSPASSVEDLNGTLSEIQALTAAQQKVLKRAAQWEARVELAKRSMPEGITLAFFRDPEDVESAVLDLVEQAAESG